MTMGQGHHSQDEFSAGLPLDEGLRLSARRAARPRRSRLEARGATGWPAPEVDFVGSGTLERRMWPMLVVPCDEGVKLALQRVTQHWHNRQYPSAAILQGPDEAFDYRDAPRLADGTLAMAYAVPLAPRLEGGAGKLHAA